MAEVFARLHRAGLTQGDTKATNFLVHEGLVQLIDLDGLKRPRIAFQRRFARHVERFLANWEDPLVRERFAAALARRQLPGAAMSP